MGPYITRDTGISPTNFSYDSVALDCSTNLKSLIHFSTPPTLGLKRFNSLTSSALITHALDLERQLVQLRVICSIGLIHPIDFIGLENATNATNATYKHFNMAEKKADAPAAGMLWGGRFTGSNVSGNKLRMQSVY